MNRNETVPSLNIWAPDLLVNRLFARLALLVVAIFLPSAVAGQTARERADDYPALSTWQPVVQPDGTVELRGAVETSDPILVWYAYGTGRTMTSSTAPMQLFPNKSSQYFHLTIPAINGDSLFVQLRTDVFTDQQSAPRSLRLPAPAAPHATTLRATGPGETEAPFVSGMTLNGAILPSDLPTSYFFEYGTSPGLGLSTLPQRVGPAISATYRESFDRDEGNCIMYPNDPIYVAKGEGVTGDCVTPVTYASFLDPNHLSGTGYLHLTLFSYTWFASPYYGNHAIGGNYPDMRDARIEFCVRTKDFAGNGADLRFWAQSQTQESYTNWRRANWVMTDQSLLPDSLIDDTWQHVAVTISNDANNWAYAGNNTAQPNGNRYIYWPLDSTLSTRMLDFIFALTPVDSAHLPSGTLAFDDLKLVYRNHSLLSPGNGARLTGWPSETFVDPLLMTDGSRDAFNSWSGASATDSAVFDFDIDSASGFWLVQAIQHPDWPAASVRVLASENGSSFADIGTISLPQPDGLSPNRLVGRLELADTIHASHIRFIIFPNESTQQFGIAELELFGEVASPNPGADRATVNTDIADLTPGSVYYYRLVAVNDSGMSAGAIDSFVAPLTFAPRTLTATPAVVDHQSALLRASVQGMGDTAVSYFYYGTDSTCSQVSDSVTIFPNDYHHATFASLLIDSLLTGGTYFFQSVVQTGSGMVRSPIYQFQVPSYIPSTPLTVPKSVLTPGDTFVFEILQAGLPEALNSRSTKIRFTQLPDWLSYDDMSGTVRGIVPDVQEGEIDILAYDLIPADGPVQSALFHFAILPGSFALEQNYPNPFNPSTQISFELPIASNVRLDIYNALGQLVEPLVAEQLTAGRHTVVWYPTGASGVYFARLEATPAAEAGAGFSAVTKMTFVK